jgi:hypothetical protein
MSISIVANNIIALQNTTERVSITIQDTSVDPPVALDPYDLKLTVTDINGTVKIYDTWPTPNSRIVRLGDGQFYVDFGPATAELDANHLAGVSTLNILDAVPLEGSAWPSEGEIIIDYGNEDKVEELEYDALSITAGTGTITLTSATEMSHVEGAYIRGPARETNCLNEYLFNWRIQMTASSQIINSIQKVIVSSHKTISLISDLKLMIDKSRKFIAPESECYLGYTDANLVNYLIGGLTSINAYQPSLTFTFETFPLTYRQILIEASMVVGVMSQQLYAVDTDIPNYSDNGVSFSFQHQPQLASFMNSLTQRLDKLIPQMKLQLISSGVLHTQLGPNYRMQQVLNAAPNGALFRGVFFASHG